MDTQPDERGLQPAAEMRYLVAPVTTIEVRDPTGNDDNTWTMSGYAAVFNKKTTLYDGRFVKLTETIDSHAFDDVLANQQMDSPDGVVHFNFGHDMNRAVAATDVPPGQPGSLVLEAHDQGLHFLARVPRDDPDGVAMAAKMRSGVLRQASFAFTVASDETKITEREDQPEEEHRTILSLGHLYDVCATPQGAYPQTVAGLRSYAAAIGQPFGEATRVSRESEGASLVSPEDVGGEGGFKDLKLERIHAEFERMKARYPQK